MNLIQQAVADGANLIQQQGAEGLDNTMKFPFGGRLVHNSYDRMFVIEERVSALKQFDHLVAEARKDGFEPITMMEILELEDKLRRSQQSR